MTGHGTNLMVFVPCLSQGCLKPVPGEITGDIKGIKNKGAGQILKFYYYQRFVEFPGYFNI